MFMISVLRTIMMIKIEMSTWEKINVKCTYVANILFIAKLFIHNLGIKI